MEKKRPLPRILYLLLTAAACTFQACMTVSYVGDRYQPTQQIDVYYAEKDIRTEYRVIGHLSEKVTGSEERAKEQLIAKCREVGADGIIILGFEYGGAKETEEYQKAQAIKYID